MLETKTIFYSSYLPLPTAFLIFHFISRETRLHHRFQEKKSNNKLHIYYGETERDDIQNGVKEKITVFKSESEIYTYTRPTYIYRENLSLIFPRPLPRPRCIHAARMLLSSSLEIHAGNTYFSWKEKKWSSIKRIEWTSRAQALRIYAHTHTRT